MKKRKTIHFLFKTTPLLTGILGAGLLINNTQGVLANSETVNSTVSSTEATSQVAPASTEPSRATVTANATVTPSPDGTVAQVGSTTTTVDPAQVDQGATSSVQVKALTEEDKARIARQIEMVIFDVSDGILNNRYSTATEIENDFNQKITVAAENFPEAKLSHQDLYNLYKGQGSLLFDSLSPETKDKVTQVIEAKPFLPYQFQIRSLTLKEADLANVDETLAIKAISYTNTTGEKDIVLKSLEGLDKLKAAKHGDTVTLTAYLFHTSNTKEIAEPLQFNVIVDNNAVADNSQDDNKTLRPMLMSEWRRKASVNGTIKNPGDTANTQKTTVNASFGTPSSTSVNNSSSSSNPSGSQTTARSLNLPSTGETTRAVVLVAGLATLGLAALLFFKHRPAKK